MNIRKRQGETGAARGIQPLGSGVRKLASRTIAEAGLLPRDPYYADLAARIINHYNDRVDMAAEGLQTRPGYLMQNLGRAADHNTALEMKTAAPDGMDIVAKKTALAIYDHVALESMLVQGTRSARSTRLTERALETAKRFQEGGTGAVIMAFGYDPDNPPYYRPAEQAAQAKREDILRQGILRLGLPTVEFTVINSSVRSEAAERHLDIQAALQEFMLDASAESTDPIAREELIFPFNTDFLIEPPTEF